MWNSSETVVSKVFFLTVYTEKKSDYIIRKSVFRIINSTNVYCCGRNKTDTFELFCLPSSLLGLQYFRVYFVQCLYKLEFPSVRTWLKTLRFWGQCRLSCKTEHLGCMVPSAWHKFIMIKKHQPENIVVDSHGCIWKPAILSLCGHW